MTLEQFKTIYWWEYSHRLLGRFSWIVLSYSFTLFHIQKSNKKKFINFIIPNFISYIFSRFYRMVYGKKWSK